ncbi:uncharacterized protein DUF1761 [Promicromonospora sp. AC04]|uniref:DUF1761 domain-containing protein n=1 Tax=Promicromonospora sp. AC04 TaxID=2135723 RepID=UPI000D3866A2|nr:DUF1761 domain-containing protein [Promicromonospora sp. AC04]PUB26107.1 uncharacterized protein DUF1761 [Promicromonospora sp. AC04]
MIPEVNYWAVIVATLSTLVVGSVWYTPRVFGKRWMRLAKVDQEAARAAGVWPIVVTVIVSFLTAWVLAGATYISWEFYDGSFFTAAVVTAVMLWIGFTAARIITHDAFEGRPSALTTLNLAHELVTILVMAVIIGVWPPAGV